MQDLPVIRKQKGLRQQDVADYLGMSQSTYAYKEATGGFNEAEMAKIARHLKVDMNYIVWKPTVTGKISDDRDRKIQQQAETIIKLEAEVKTLQSMIDKLLVNRRS